jgi:Tol biopolymer transport system component
MSRNYKIIGIGILVGFLIVFGGQAFADDIHEFARKGNLDGIKALVEQDPEPVDASVNDYPHHWHFSVDVDHTIYFSSSVPDRLGEGDIYCAELVDGEWQKPQNLGKPINTPSIEICPMVSPDGKYLFFLSQRGGESHIWWVDAGFIEKLKQ